ncbi:MAG: putative Ig domain-containing protein [Verrucomicrobiota bacterium]
MRSLVLILMLGLSGLPTSAQSNARPEEERVILTPPAPATPRINGPKLFGVRPGSPFLFTIPATGERPMTFAADHLPAGLAVNATNGQITGTIEKKGTSMVVVKASNRFGTAERPFKIVCGDELALTPHMGWNSWYVWENHVTDQIMREAADAMVASGLMNHGYSYVNIDDCWAISRGRRIPPLAANRAMRRARLMPTVVFRT